MTARERTLLLKVVEDVSQATKGIESLDKRAGRLTGAFKKAAVAGAALFAGGQVLEFTKNVVDAGATVTAFEDTARTVFGEVGNEAVEAAKAAEGIGLSRRQALEQLNYLGNLAQATGATAEESLDLSKQTLQLGADFAAFADVPTADVLEAISSATRGEFDALQRYLPTASAATLQSIAREKALIGEGEALSGAAALQAVYELALRDGGAAIGAYERESDSLQATTGRLSARWENFQADIGAKLIPALERAAQWFEEVLLPAIEDVVEYVKDQWPKIYDEWVKPTMDKVGEIITDVLDTLGEAWEQWGEGIQSVLGEWVELLLAAGETVFEVLAGIIDFLVAVFAKDWDAAWAAILDIAETFVTWFRELPGRIWTFVGPIVEAVASLGVAIGKGLVNGVIRAWNALDPRVSLSVPSWIPGIGGSAWQSGDLIPDLPYLAAGGIVNRPTLAVIGESGPEAVVPLGSGFGNTYNINVEAGISDPQAVADAVADAITRYDLANGSALRGRG